jgi:hypothetical protein
VILERHLEQLGQHSDPVCHSLAATDENLVAAQIEFLHPARRRRRSIEHNPAPYVSEAVIYSVLQLAVRWKS